MSYAGFNSVDITRMRRQADQVLSSHVSDITNIVVRVDLVSRSHVARLPNCKEDFEFHQQRNSNLADCNSGGETVNKSRTQCW